MDIIQITNMNEFIPRYSNLWVVATRHKPQYKLRDGSIHTVPIGNLWYAFEPQQQTESFYFSFKEKLGITKLAESRKALKQWNETVKRNNPRTVTAQVISKEKIAIIPGRLAADPPMMLCYWPNLPEGIDDYSGYAGHGGDCLVELSLDKNERKYEEQSEEA